MSIGTHLKQIVATAGVAAVALAGASDAGGTATSAATVPTQPSITGVSFSGASGAGVTSPTITVTGSGFGAAPPAIANDVTSCGTYTANGSVYGTKLYFVADNHFEAGYGVAGNATCIGVIVSSWSPKKVVLRFGSSYGSFAHWYLQNGDGFALSAKLGIWGGVVTGLTP